MIEVTLLLLIVSRFLLVGIKTGFNSLTRVDLHQLAGRSALLEDLLDRRISYQFSLATWGNLLLAAILLLVLPMLSTMNSYSYLLLLILAIAYLAIEKFLVSTVFFVNREWLLVRLLVVYRPFHYMVLIPLLPAYLVARKLMVIEDEREEDEEEREIEEQAFIDVATEDGIIEEEEKALIKGVLNFGETIVREIMTPRTDIVAADMSTDYDTLMDIFRKAKHSRVPVFRDTVDDIVGILHLKDLIEAETEKFEVKPLLQQPFYMPETKKVAELLREMQMARTKMAVVLDEYGGTAGIVTIEDLVEEIVGEIEDEHDPLEVEIQELPDGTLRVDGRCNAEDLAEKTGIAFNVEEIDTVGGAVFSVFGRIPAEGDEIESDGIRIRVEKMNRRRVVRVLLERIEGWADEQLPEVNG